MLENNTLVVLLGTGTPNAEPDRMGSSLAIVVNDFAYLVDFGSGVVRRANAAFKDGLTALDPTKITVAFLSHFHSDHTTGLADLIYTPWVMGREKPLNIYGPPGLDNMVEHILQAYEMDKDMRVCGFEPRSELGYAVISHEISAGVCFQDEHVKVEAFAVDHGEGWLALGYQFTTADRRIVISGDTRPMPALIDMWRGCDVLVHEVYSSAGYQSRPKDWQRYHAQMHTSTKELASIASMVKPTRLLLTHLLMWGQSEQALVEEIQAGYDGEVICGEDLGVY